MKMQTILPALALIASGCTTPKASLDRVQATVAERTGKRVHWNRGGAEDAQIKQGVQTSLGRELTAESAVQIALLNNHDLQARFEEIGICRGFDRGGIAKQPKLCGQLSISESSPSGTDIEYSIAQNFLDLLVLPLRRRIAAAQLAQTETRVADAVLKLAAEVKTAFYTVRRDSNC